METLLTELLKVPKTEMQKYPQPLSFYTSIDMKPLMFHVLNVGEGLMVLVIFPDQTTMLYDCNLIQDEKDALLRFLRKHIPSRYDLSKKKNAQWIDVYVNSHRDQDHYRGLSDISNEFEIRSIWDSGRSGETTQDADYQYYMGLRRSLIEKYGNEAVFVPKPSVSPIVTLGGARIFCLSSSLESVQMSTLKEAKIQHTEAIVLSIHYAGRSLLLTSDSDWKAWKDKIIPDFGESGILRSNILLASHHGSRSFFTNEEQNEKIDIENNPDTTYLEHIDYINPDIVLISCGEFKQFHHPNGEALSIYKSKTTNQQVYSTNEKGHFSGYIDNEGKWSVIPNRFWESTSSGGPSFDILCKMKFNGTEQSKRSGDFFPIKSSLSFSLVSHGGLMDPFKSFDVWWEVSNGGINNDHNHQEIYYKHKSEIMDKTSFNRDVAYEGCHLLRCRVRNKTKGIDITKVFVVNGYNP